MKIKKKELFEIIDSNGELIGKNDTPTTGSDLETQASNTTDYNQKIGTQPFRYDMLGRFGFTLLPFFEGKEDQEQKELLKDLAQLMHDRRIDVLKYYYKNPNLLKPDYRKQVAGEAHSEQCEKEDITWARKIVKLIEPHFEKAFKEPIDEDEISIISESNIVEDSVAEDKLVDKKSEDEISKRDEDKEIKEKRLEKIAGLIDKLDRDAKDKLKNLLEAKEETEFSVEEKKEISDFVLNYKGDFKDEDVHKLGKKLGLEIPEVEEFIYNLARKGIKKD
jgi:hypothetical protein